MYMCVYTCSWGGQILPDYGQFDKSFGHRVNKSKKIICSGVEVGGSYSIGGHRLSGRPTFFLAPSLNNFGSLNLNDFGISMSETVFASLLAC